MQALTFVSPNEHELLAMAAALRPDYRSTAPGWCIIYLSIYLSIYPINIQRVPRVCHVCATCQMEASRTIIDQSALDTAYGATRGTSVNFGHPQLA
jgi:hypothetical protein